MDVPKHVLGVSIMNLTNYLKLFLSERLGHMKNSQPSFIVDPFSDYEEIIGNIGLLISH